jgi:hypothetical protein
MQTVNSCTSTLKSLYKLYGDKFTPKFKFCIQQKCSNGKSMCIGEPIILDSKTNDAVFANTKRLSMTFWL